MFSSRRRALLAVLGSAALLSSLFPGPAPAPAAAQSVLRVGDVQGDGARSPYAPESGNSNGATVDVRGVVTQRLRFRTSSGGTNYGFFLQDTLAAADGNPATSDGIFVFHGRFTTLLRVGSGSYFPEVGDQVVLRGPVAEFFDLTQLVNPRLVTEESDRGVDVTTEIAIAEANPPDELADARLYWERHEGMQFSVPAGSRVTGARDVFASTADGEVWVIRGHHQLANRANDYAERVFRDPHPLDDVGGLGSFDNDNGMRILLVSHGLKWAASNSNTLIAPARTFDTVTNRLQGGLYFAFGKYGIEVTEQPALSRGANPAQNSPPQAHDTQAEYATAPFNVENLYDHRDDPFDGCDFAGNPGCPGVRPPFDYVPASAADYQAHLAALAEQIVDELHAPDILLIQEAEDQDICTVDAGSLTCGSTNNADGKPDTLQELGLAIEAAGGPAYDAAYDRDGADDRGIVSAFLYRTDRVELLPVDASHRVLGKNPRIKYRSDEFAYNADVQNPKALNAELPDGVDVGDMCDEPVPCVFTRDPQVGWFRVWRDGIGTSVFTDLYAISNHFSSTPNSRVEQRTEQAAYNAAIVEALRKTDDGDRIVVGGDFNVYPRPDDPFPPPNKSDQLAALYASDLTNLWNVVVDEAPANAYSYVFEGQAQTLDSQFVTDVLDDELNGVRYAHINADWPAEHDGDGARGASDHDPQVARFTTLPTPERLVDLILYFGETGQIQNPGTAEQLAARLAQAFSQLDSGREDVFDTQFDQWLSELDKLTPKHIDPIARDLILSELALLLED